jgi:peptide/nickel transport system ATP-binding protein
MPLLAVRDLEVSYEVDGRSLRAVRGVGFELEEGEGAAIVGESGSGKSTIALAIMGLLPRNGRVVSGRIEFEGRDLLGLSEQERRRIRWRQISMIFQGSMNALDPILKVGRQLRKVLEHHLKLDEAAAQRTILEAIARVNLRPSVLDLYPHELSGGMKQRVVIAMALLLKPRLLIADEPTTALDVTTQAEIIHLLRSLIREQRMSLLLITHDLSLVPQLCGRVVILYGGTTMEVGAVKQVFQSPRNPYTQALINSVIAIGRRGAEPIPGDPPTLHTLPLGCPFHARCRFAFRACREALPAEVSVEGRMVRCHLYGGASNA